MLKINTKKARISALETRCQALEIQTRTLAGSTLGLGVSTLMLVGMNHRQHKKMRAETDELRAQLISALSTSAPAPEKVQAEVVTEEKPAGEGGSLFGNYSKKEPEAETPEAPEERKK